MDYFPAINTLKATRFEILKARLFGKTTKCEGWLFKTYRGKIYVINKLTKEQHNE